MYSHLVDYFPEYDGMYEIIQLFQQKNQNRCDICICILTDQPYLYEKNNY